MLSVMGSIAMWFNRMPIDGSGSYSVFWRVALGWIAALCGLPIGMHSSS